ncbi:hypothetical protein CK203_022890 [Vitis vinifera]|uniref:Uncharacterized protein n=1 Tax=Vitis vinifera TaxID=29760 RepID=A0A438IWJ0_VITVI|nr:hypothetical protein CK203_022890 [Vitis vinifera]
MIVSIQTQTQPSQAKLVFFWAGIGLDWAERLAWFLSSSQSKAAAVTPGEAAPRLPSYDTMGRMHSRGYFFLSSALQEDSTKLAEDLFSGCETAHTFL